MLEIGAKGGNGAAGSDADVIVDGADASFMADVIEESRRRPVVVDFWAPWCGPCRQLTPALEKTVRAAGGKVRLVKVNIDENPRIAGQLRIQSIPAVYAFADGQPVDGFMGALPESQVKAFIDRLTGAAGDGADADLEALLSMAAESVGVGDMGGAAQAYAQVLQRDPKNAKAIAGLARCYLAGGDVDRAREVLEMAPADAKEPEIAAARAALELAAQADGETADLERRLSADPNDHQARYDLAAILAGRGEMQAAVDNLLYIVERDRAWNDDGARKQLLTVFEAAGPMSDVAKAGRRRLSALLFS